MAKRNSAAVVTRDGQKLYFEWSDGQRDVFDADRMTPEQREHAMMHGFTQTLRDAYALPTVEKNGAWHRPTLDEKRNALRERLETLNSGAWQSARGEGTTGGALYRAVREHFTNARGEVPSRVATVENFREWVETQAAAMKCTKRKIEDKLRENPRIAAILERMARENGAPEIDSDALLDQIPD